MRCMRQGRWKGRGAPRFCSHTRLLNRHVVTSPETSWSLSFCPCMEASSRRHGWLNHQSLAIDWPSCSSPEVWYSAGGKRGKGGLNPLISRLVPMAVLKCFQRLPHSYNKRHLYHSQHLGNFQCSESCEPEMAQRLSIHMPLRDHHIFLINHSIIEAKINIFKKWNRTHFKVPKVSHMVIINIVSISFLFHKMHVYVWMYMY